MGKKRKKRSPEERAAEEERHERTMRMLRERIDYYEAKIRAATEQQER
jgi:hypothetical protein